MVVIYNLVLKVKISFTTMSILIKYIKTIFRDSRNIINIFLWDIDETCVNHNFKTWWFFSIAYWKNCCYSIVGFIREDAALFCISYCNVVLCIYDRKGTVFELRNKLCMPVEFSCTVIASQNVNSLTAFKQLWPEYHTS